MSKREEVRERAQQRYRMDYAGILLNTLVSATSSLTAAGLLNFVKSVPPSEMPVIVAVIFVAQIVPKLMVELNKRYKVNKAKRKGFSDGVLSDSFDDGSGDGKTTLDIIFWMCDHASYF